ncbi:alpha-(1-_3)-arabinofuranosyltransferase [Rhodococcus rhodnii]|uniref:alpha-(1->3)-arabinofuranosyltransferase n=2 Tax=Rhodococcus rhodnii TaxID=38312 RepID=UPI00093359B0|nr:alpha-(1->3)-arabinofuranosyltransferase [Rhodococcus rhodnii]
MTRRWLAAGAVVSLILAFVQSPGLIAADTKYDLTENPLGFLARAAHLWSSQSPLGQVQNQAYGYFFPHGAFFALGDLAGIPAWITQRLWWALLLLVGFWGVVRLAEALGVGSRASRVVAGIAFALSPRVVTTLGSISSETLPMMLAPWVLLPVVLALNGGNARSLRLLAARSALAVALMGAVNAAATAMACLVAALWWIVHRPNRTWWIFTLWWIPFVALATLWWIVPLLLLGALSPPFLDYIESAAVTTQWTSLAEVLRGTGSWTPFVSPERVGGAVLVTQPAAVVVTGAVAAAGLAGLAMRRMPGRGRLVFVLLVGIAGLTIGYLGQMSSPVAEQVRMLLDGPGAPLRNIHKLEPLVRLPIALGIAHLLAKVPLPGAVPARQWRSAFAHPERNRLVAFASLILVALAASTALVWTGKAAPRGAYSEVPQYWHDAAAWLDENAGDGADAARALVVPGAPFGVQVWGLTRDEPLQALAQTPWAVRDAVPLTPGGAIRSLDSVQRLLADGRSSEGLATTLRSQGVGYLVVRNDLDPATSRSTRPILVHQALDGSPGVEKVAEFGETVERDLPDDVVADGDLRPPYPAVEIYRVGSEDAPPVTAGPYTVDADAVPRVQGGPEAVQRLAENGGLAQGPVLFAPDAHRADLPVGPITVTDMPRDRETDFGRVDGNTSGLRAPDDPRRTRNAVADYDVPDTPRVEGSWTGADVTVSSSAADATQLGGASPGATAAAAFDGDPSTGWFSSLSEAARGQWLELDLDTPVDSALFEVTTSPAALGAPVRWLEVETDSGTTAVKIDSPGEPVTVALPGGGADRIRITASRTEDGSAGVQFGISEVRVLDFAGGEPTPVPIVHRTALPPVPDGAQPQRWLLTQELPGRRACVESDPEGGDVRCNTGLPLPAEEAGPFTRSLSVPSPTAVEPEITLRSRAGAALDELLATPDHVTATGLADVTDPRGGPAAATDGDPRTSWTAPQSGVGSAGPLATLDLDLPEDTEVTALRLTAAEGALPAAPTRVAVDLGNGPQVRDVEWDGGTATVPLHGHTTDRIAFGVVDTEEVADLTAFGAVERRAGGVAEIAVLGAGGDPVAGSGVRPESETTGRIVTVPCETGPVLRIGGTAVRTSITATAGALAAGDPVRATVCDDGETPLPIPAGDVDVRVDPGSAFSVDSVLLTTPGSGALGGAEPRPTGTGAWTANHREVSLAPADEDRLLVVPESVNPGWQARVGDTALTSVVVDGWQQGWVVPAGAVPAAGGDVTLEYPADDWYRLSVFGGLALLVPLLAAALVRPRRLVARPTSRTWRSPVLAAAGLLVAAVVAGGWWGGAVALAVGGGAFAVARRRGTAFASRALVVLTGTAALAGSAALATGPWQSRGGYVGHEWWVQLPFVVSVVALGVATLPLSRAVVERLTERRFRSRSTARRDGSSTSA